MSTILNALRRVQQEMLREESALAPGPATEDVPTIPDEALSAEDRAGIVEFIDEVRTSLASDTSPEHSTDAELADVRAELARCQGQLAKALQQVKDLDRLRNAQAADLRMLRHHERQLEEDVRERDVALESLTQVCMQYAEDNARLYQRVENLTAVCARRQQRIDAYREQLRHMSIEENDTPDSVDGIGTLAFNGHDKLGDLLLQIGALVPEQLSDALREQANGPRRPLGSILVSKGYVEEHAVAEALARQQGLPLLRLSPKRMQRDLARLVRRNLAERHLIVPVAVRDRELVLAMANPRDLVAIDDIEVTTGRRVVAVVAAPSNIVHAIAHLYA